ncbi:MAG: GGDEF domain-containing protein [Desulfobulbaceae bacterium A2]|nr:MAG: GGDEF domain-containing protein [Desulfobulbaceae bacterium A2]
MSQNELLDKILASGDLPTLPTVASKLLALTGQEDNALAEIATLISQDVSLTVKILKVSNSSFYSFPKQISSIHQAVSVLGINAVRSLVLSFSFLSIKGSKHKGLFNLEKFWQRSLANAMSAKLILEEVHGADAEEAFVAGLLQNLGELIFVRTIPKEYEKVLVEVQQDGDSLLATEERILGLNHATVGAKVADAWKLPALFGQTILLHHQPEAFNENNKALAQTIKAVFLADLLTSILYTDKAEHYHREFRQEAKKLLGLSPTAVNKILQRVHLEVDRAGEYFGLKMEPTKSVQEILQEANLRLSLLNMSYEEMNRELVRSKIQLEKLTRELEQKNKMLENMAHIDGLTEIHNHRYFQNFLDQEIKRAVRSSRPISLLLADIDNFKVFNDTYGHQTGDFVLKEFCRLTGSLIREYDLLARYGGEEFIFVLPETDLNQAVAAAEKLRQAVAEHPFEDGERNYQVTVSIGVASAIPETNEFKKNAFIDQADTALYEAKKKGRNRVMASEGKKKWFGF